ncbi:hypothetical protein EDB19DRAFT_1833794 [Suillus lakei]|nr:hypothetical protein EDB19DRAFT_1833794 [Suillus lakei]
MPHRIRDKSQAPIEPQRLLCGNITFLFLQGVWCSCENVPAESHARQRMGNAQFCRLAGYPKAVIRTAHARIVFTCCRELAHPQEPLSTPYREDMLMVNLLESGLPQNINPLYMLSAT